MTFARFVPVLLAACAAPVEEPPPEDPAELEAGNPLAEQYHVLARRHLARSEYVAAREAIDRAIRLDPGNDAYREVKTVIDVELGDRNATASYVAREAAEREAARREEELVAVRRLLHEAETAKRIGDWEEAKRAYERALFVLRTSRYREDEEFGALSGPARDGLAEASENR